MKKIEIDELKQLQCSRIRDGTGEEGADVRHGQPPRQDRADNRGFGHRQEFLGT